MMNQAPRGQGLQKRWRLAPPAPPELASLLGLPPLWAQLLYNRGITEAAQAEAFLSATPASLHDPFLMPQMDRAVHRITRAMLAGEMIGIYGDFDTDGVTATALLFQALKGVGANVLTYIPHRVREGHGLNLEAIEALAAQGVSLLITVDCGITALKEVQEATGRGIETIITDHHVPPPIMPSAWAVVTPLHPGSQYPFPHLAGVGLAFKLAQALYQTLGKPLEPGLFELVALGTVADMAPLQGENRSLVKVGLEHLNRAPRPGIRALLSQAGVHPDALDAESIGFTIAPRLNAAGRLDSAYPSLQLLTTSSPQEATELARVLERLNAQRQRQTEELLQLAFEQAQSQGEEALLFVQSGSFSPGINGLVASRLAEESYRPAVVVALDEVARGSGRSIPEFDLHRAFAQCQDLFLRFGGHPGAAGFIAQKDSLPALRQRLQALARLLLAHQDLHPTLALDARATFRSLLGETLQFIQRLAPFGVGNHAPVFLARGVEVVEAAPAGASGQHLRMKLKQDGATWDAIAFRQALKGEMTAAAGREMPRGLRLDVAYTLGVDSFGGEPTVKLFVRDFRPAS